MRRTFGVDVSDVPVHRGPGASVAAHALGAHAFTRDGEVFLPADAGPLDQPVGRGLLAHELTHAAQQRALGSALPGEDSAAGAALEAQAVAAERWARGLDPAPAQGGMAPAPTESGVPAAASWNAPWLADGWPVQAGGGVQRAKDVAGTPEPPRAPVVAAAPTDVARPGVAAPGLAATRDSVRQAAPTAAQAVRATEAQLPSASDGALSPERFADRDRPGEAGGRRPLDLDDPGDIEELAARVYPTIHGRLRRELLVDRERAGRLRETDPFGWTR